MFVPPKVAATVAKPEPYDPLNNVAFCDSLRRESFALGYGSALQELLQDGKITAWDVAEFLPRRLR